MKVAIDKLGRIVLPKKVRNHLGLRAGDELELEEQGDAIILRFEPESSGLQIKNGVLVFTGEPTGDLQLAEKTERLNRIRKLGF
jgi:AbrB family looped-hinge helix DNA binding protein